MFVRVNKDSSDANLKFRYYFEYLYRAYSHGHLQSQQLYPQHVQLFYNQYNNLYLSLSTAEIGAMNAIIYDKATGHQITVHRSEGYDGSYHIGNLAKIPEETDTLSMALKVGDLIYHQDFGIGDVMDN